MSDKPSIADRPDDQVSEDPPSPADGPGRDVGDERPPYEPEGDEEHEAGTASG